MLSCLRKLISCSLEHLSRGWWGCWCEARNGTRDRGQFRPDSDRNCPRSCPRAAVTRLVRKGSGTCLLLSDRCRYIVDLTTKIEKRSRDLEGVSQCITKHGEIPETPENTVVAT